MIMLKTASPPHTHLLQADLQQIGNTAYVENSEMKAELVEALSEEAAALRNEAELLLHRRQELLTWRSNLLRVQS